MRRILSSDTRRPHLVIVQGAYEQFCGTAEPIPTVALSCLDAQFEWADVAGSLFTALVTSPPAEDWLKFQRLFQDWRAERGATSAITEAAACPAYQGIIGMGEAAVPLILAQLESEGDEPDQWFWALKAITGADPVRDEDRGDFLKMAQTWIGWARAQGYAW